MSIWIIGDIHGCFDTFQVLLKKLPKGDKVCLVGDLIDRGPKSKEVVQYVMDNNIDCVKGNHEVMMVDNPSYWSLNGGYETLISYSDMIPSNLGDGQHIHKFLDVPLFDEHKKWMDLLPVFIEYPDIKNEDGRYLVISHSILHDVWKLKDTTEPYKWRQFENTAMWSRSFNVKDNPEIYNIFGHTPQGYKPKITKIYANVDTGCCFIHYEEHGILSALKFPEMEIITQENIEVKKEAVMEIDKLEE